MAKNYEAPIAVRELEKMISNFTYKNGFEISRVFDDWLIFIIYNFNPQPVAIPDWKYKPEHNKVFAEMMHEWFKTMNREVTENSWFDAFGCLYEAVIAGSGRRSNSGQFFTPEHICDLMTKLTYSDDLKGKGVNVNDPTCGSGRTLLSFQMHAPGNYLVGEDMDRTCVLMTACNFMMHGVVGEVVWHDSLKPDSWFGGWKTNAHLNNPFHKLNGVPTIEPMEKEDSFVWKFWEQKRLEVAEAKLPKSEKKEMKKIVDQVIILESTKHVNQLALF